MKTNIRFLSHLAVILRMRNVSDKICTENLNTYFMFNYVLLSRAIYEIMWKNRIEPDRPQMKIRRLRIACWTPKATNTHSQYVIIIGFPLKI